MAKSQTEATLTLYGYVIGHYPESALVLEPAGRLTKLSATGRRRVVMFYVNTISPTPSLN